MWFLCLSRSIYLFFLVLFSFLALVFLFRLSFYLTVSLYVLSLRWPWSLSWACKMCEICVEEKSFYIQIIMKNKGIEEASGAHTFPEKKKKKNIPSSTTSPIQVVKFCSSVVVASNLFASTKIYLLLNQNCKEIAKRKKKTPHHLSLVGVSVLGLVRQILGLGFAW